jgi:hypothetical protein
MAAIRQARQLLVRLADHRQTSRVPGPIRAEARALLRMMPTAERLRLATPEPLSEQPREEGAGIGLDVVIGRLLFGELHESSRQEEGKD